MKAPRTRGRLRGRAALAAALLAVPLSLLSPAAPAVAAIRLCGPTETVSVSGGEYVAQNNIWGAETPQCITVDGTSFTVDTAAHDNSADGAPAAYPSLFKGCHWGRCTTGGGLPVRVDGMPSVTSDWSTTLPGSGTYNAAYDLWYNTTPSATGAPDGAELMIWLDRRGPVQPAGKRVATGVPIAGAAWDVWTTRMDWRYIAYVRTSGTASADDLDLRAFTRDAVARGAVEEDWYLIGVEAGFEIWQGGTGLCTDAFSVEVDGASAQSGPDVHAVNASHDGAVPEGGPATFGFQAGGAAPGATAVACAAG